MKTMQEIEQECEDVGERVDYEGAFDFPIGEIERQSPFGAVTWMAKVMNEISSGDTYVNSLLNELFTRAAAGKSSADWAGRVDFLVKQHKVLSRLCNDGLQMP
jgi:hypothetical protein